ncbi:uncharacterized protein LOC144920746 [Branchiostoma floridae x Branchiostoma belcheri]
MAKLYSPVLHVHVLVTLCCAVFYIYTVTAETGSASSSAVHGEVAGATRFTSRRLLAVEPSVRTVVEGQNITLPCVVPDATNTTKVKWLGPNMNRVLTINRRAMRRRVSLTGNETEGEYNLLLNSVEHSDDGTYHCRAGKIVHATTRLKVLTEADTPVISGFKWPVVEGARVKLTCSCHGGLPQPSLYWTLASLQQPTQELSYSQHTLQITTELHVRREHNGAVLSCTADQRHHLLVSPKTASVIMEVLYPPDVSVIVQPRQVREGDDVIVTCIVDSNPPAHISWKRQVQGRNVVMATAGTTTIVLRNVTRQDNGTYICRAGNDIGTASASGVVHVKKQAQGFDIPVDTMSMSSTVQDDFRRTPFTADPETETSRATVEEQQGNEREERLRLILGLAFGCGLLATAVLMLGHHFRILSNSKSRIGMQEQPSFELAPVNVNSVHYNRPGADVEATETEDGQTPQQQDREEPGTTIEGEAEVDGDDQEMACWEGDDVTDDERPQSDTIEHPGQFEYHGNQTQTIEETSLASLSLGASFTREQLRFIKRLGHGQFGDVYLAELEGVSASQKDRLVAVKTVKGVCLFVSLFERFFILKAQIGMQAAFH